METQQLLEQWTAIQTQLKQQLVETDRFEWTLNRSSPNTLQLVGGFDISFSEENNSAIACLVVLTLSSMEVVYEDYERIELNVPYVAGFLAFREADPFVNLLHRVSVTEFNPPVVLVDGNGVLHPRRFGSASHLGVVSNCPTIGVGKSLHCIDGLEERVIKNRIRQITDSPPPRQPNGPFRYPYCLSTPWIA